MSSLNLRKLLIQTWAFLFKNWIVTKRNAFSFFEILFWPTVGFFSVGLLTRFLDLDADMSSFILIGIISMSLIQVCQIDVAYALLYDLWSKSLKHTFMAPVHSFQLILGSWMFGIVRSLFVFLFLSVASHLAFGFDFFQPGIGALVLFLLGLFGISACHWDCRLYSRTPFWLQSRCGCLVLQLPHGPGLWNLLPHFDPSLSSA